MATCTSHLLIHSYSLRFNPASLLGGIKYLCSPNNTNKIGPQLGTVFLCRLGTSLFSSCPLVLVSSFSSTSSICLLLLSFEFPHSLPSCTYPLVSVPLILFFPLLFVKYLFKLSVYLVFFLFPTLSTLNKPTRASQL